MHKIAVLVLLAVGMCGCVAAGSQGNHGNQGAQAQSGAGTQSGTASQSGPGAQNGTASQSAAGAESGNAAAKLPATTAEERAWIVAAAADLEANPMGPKAAGERTHMLMLLMERSDIRVIACTNLVADVPKGDKDNYPVLMQAWYSSASYAVQHNGGDAASVDQMLAGVEGALRVYETFLKARPQDREPALDAVVALRDHGNLREYVAGRPAVCRCCK